MSTDVGYAGAADLVITDATTRAQTILDMLVAGTVTADEASLMLAVVVARANDQSAQLACIYVAAAAGGVEPVVVPLPPQTVGRLTTAATTILTDVPADGDQDGRPPRVRRLATEEPRRAAQDAFRAALAGTPGVLGYRRGVEPGACRMCAVWHWRDGYVWPPGRPFWRHPGCGCHPIPVTRNPNPEGTTA